MTRPARPIPERRLRPPMGWNSWDCYGTTVTEEEVLANATFMRDHMLAHGWDTVVVDIQWYEPTARAHGYNADAPLVLDDRVRELWTRTDTPHDGQSLRAELPAHGAAFYRLSPSDTST